MSTLLLNAATFAELFPVEPTTAPMPREVTRYDGPRPPPPPPEAFEDEAPPKKRARQAKPTPSIGPDPRLPSNLAAHVWANDGLQRRTPAQRRKLMSACPCRLCALALTPPLTFAEHARLGLGAASFAQVRWTLRQLDREARAARKAENGAGDAELAASV